MKFLFLNQTFHPDVASTGQHLADLALALARCGHKVTVVTSRRGYDYPHLVFARNETWRGVRIRRAGSTGFGKTARWRRVVDCASFIAVSLSRVPWFERQDVVVSLTSPPLVSLVGLLLARWNKCRFVYWVMDLNPDEAIAAGWLRPGSLTARTLEYLSRLSLLGADHVIALDGPMRARISAKGVAADRISIVPPWSHDAEIHFDPAGRERFRARHGLDGQFVVMYSGNHSPCHPLDTVLEAAARLQNDRRITFCFVGGGIEFRKIQARLDASRNCAGQNLVCLPYQPLSQLSDSLSAGDAHLVVMGDALVGLVHPCKTYNLLRMGAPIVYIGPVPSPISQVVAGTPGSSCFKHGDVAGFVQHIIQLRDSSNSRPHRGPFISSNEFSRETILPRLVALLEDQPATT